MMKSPLLAGLCLGLAATASAGPITGKLALGSWNTQVQYDSLQVVSGTTVLYTNDFSSNANGLTFTNGNWSVANGVLQQTGAATPAMAVFGSTNWSNYTITVKAMKTGGDEGFLVGFGMPSDDAVSWWNLGGWGNTTQALTVPGVSLPTSASTIQTNRWYDIKIVVNGSDIQCYLDNVKVYDTMRLLDDDEWTDRKSQVLNAAGYSLLPTWEQTQLTDLLNRSEYRGASARGKFNGLPGKAGFTALSASAQVPYLRAVNRNRLTWALTYVNDPNDTGKVNAIISAMDDAVGRYNSIGIFDKHLSVQSVPSSWVPTADATYDGNIRFGGSYGRSTAVHETSHTLGTGTYGSWGNLMWSGDWHGGYANAKVAEYDGVGQILHGDGMHYWPYGQNYPSEWSYESEGRTVNIVWALRRDMAINDARNSNYSTSVPDGTYRLTPRHATSSALSTTSDTSGTTVTLQPYTGTTYQQWTLTKQSDGTYTIRSVRGTKRSFQLASSSASNATQVKIGNYSGADTQRWYLIPLQDGWYKIAPKLDVWKSADLNGASSNAGTPLIVYDFGDAYNQTFQLTKLN